MRSRISNKNILPNFSLEVEYERLHRLFFDKSVFSNAIFDNSYQIIERLGAELKTDDREDELFIIYRNDVATVVSEKRSELASSIVEYLKIDNCHNLDRKGEILCTLAKNWNRMRKRYAEQNFNYYAQILLFY